MKQTIIALAVKALCAETRLEYQERRVAALSNPSTSV